MVMFKSTIKNINECLGYITERFNEDHEKKKQIYLEKLEHLCKLITLLVSKYNYAPVVLNNCVYISDKKREISYYVSLIVTERGNEWHIEHEEFHKNINDQEFAQKCWDSEADMNRFTNDIFSQIHQILSSKKDKLRKRKEKYIKNVSAIDEATVEIQKLIDAELSDEIKNVDIK